MNENKNQIIMEDLSVKYSLQDKNENYLELWKYFSKDGDNIKGKMWAMASFIYTALGVLLGFAAKYISTSPDQNTILELKEPALLVIVSFLGIILCVFGVFLLRQFGFHISDSFSRANYIRHQIKGLNEIWYFNEPEFDANEKIQGEIGKGLPRLARNLIRIMCVFLTLNLVLLLLVIIK